MTTVFKTSQGCESVWYAVNFYWKLFEVDIFSIQYVDCQRTGDLVNLTIDLVVSDGHFLQSKESIQLNGLEDYTWKQLNIDPYKSRRVDWSDEIIRCANGNVRLSGIVEVSNCPSTIQIELPICNDEQCLQPIPFDVPVIESIAP